MIISIHHILYSHAKCKYKYRKDQRDTFVYGAETCSGEWIQTWLCAFRTPTLSCLITQRFIGLKKSCAIVRCGRIEDFHLLSSSILASSQPCGNALENTQGKWIRPQDYISKDNLFYAANRALTNVGKILYVNFLKIMQPNY